MCACCLARFSRGFQNSQRVSTLHVLRTPSYCPTCPIAKKRETGGICCLQSFCFLPKPSLLFIKSFLLPPVLDHTVTCWSREHWSGLGFSTTLCMAGGRYLQCTFIVRMVFLFTYTCACSRSDRASCVQYFTSPLGCQSWAGEIVRWALYPFQIHPTGTGCAILVVPCCWGCSGRSWQWHFGTFDPWQSMMAMGRTVGHSQHEAGAMLSVPPCLGQHPEPVFLSIRSQPPLQPESARESVYPSHEMNFALTEILWCGWASLQRMLAGDQKGPCHPEMIHAASNCFWWVLRFWASQSLAQEWENTA